MTEWPWRGAEAWDDTRAVRSLAARNSIKHRSFALAGLATPLPSLASLSAV